MWEWARQNLEDIESDLSVFHRVVDADLLPADRFISLAQRLPAYKGVLRMRLEMESYAAEKQRDAATPRSHASGGSMERTGIREVKATSAQLATDPGLGGMFEVIA